MFQPFGPFACVCVCLSANKIIENSIRWRLEIWLVSLQMGQGCSSKLLVKIGATGSGFSTAFRWF